MSSQSSQGCSPVRLAGKVSLLVSQCRDGEELQRQPRYTFIVFTGQPRGTPKPVLFFFFGGVHFLEKTHTHTHTLLVCNSSEAFVGGTVAFAVVFSGLWVGSGLAIRIISFKPGLRPCPFQQAAGWLRPGCILQNVDGRIPAPKKRRFLMIPL